LFELAAGKEGEGMSEAEKELREALEHLRDSMRRQVANPMKAWSTGEVVATSTVEFWIESLDDLLAALQREGK
jgi:hypothetical protein